MNTDNLATLKQPYHCTIRLSDKTKYKLTRAVIGINYPDPGQDYEDYILDCQLAVATALPKSVRRELSLMRNSPYGSGVTLLRNLPVDEDLPPAPKSGRRAHYVKATSVAENILIGIAAAMGHPIGHQEEKDGHLIHDIIPVAGTEKQLSNEGQSDFGLHTENAVFDFREQFVILSCLWPDPYKEAITPIVDVREVLEDLDELAVNELRKAQFIIHKPYILDYSKVDDQSKSVSIIRRANR